MRPARRRLIFLINQFAFIRGSGARTIPGGVGQGGYQEQRKRRRDRDRERERQRDRDIYI